MDRVVRPVASVSHPVPILGSMTQQLVLMNGEPPQPTRHGRLDEETKRAGREGLTKARAALQEASRRAAEREAARLSRRDDELAQRAKAARTAVAPRRDTGRGQRPAAAA